MANRSSWPKATWDHPLPHDFIWSFGLSADEVANQRSTIVPFMFQDNAIIDYETIKTNKENDDFAVVAKANTAAGSFVPSLMASWTAMATSSEVNTMTVHTMPIYTSMLNRLDAFDKKTGQDIETILELTHETTDEQVMPLFTTVKLFEGTRVVDMPAEQPGLTGTQQPESVLFDDELYFDALHYYTNRQMLKNMTGRMKTYRFSNDNNAEIGWNEKVKHDMASPLPSMCKYQHPYTGCFQLFSIPEMGSIQQTEIAAVTAVEHITIFGRCRFNEFNPDFNMSRA